MMLKKICSIPKNISTMVISFVVLFVIGQMTISRIAKAGEVICPPAASNVFLQTNGPNGLLRWGDWWASNDPDAGNQPHMFEIYVPCLVDSDFTIEMQLYDPECYQTGAEVDELTGSWDDATFRLMAPDGVTQIAQQTFTPSASTSEQWNAFTTFTVRAYGCGIYRLYVSTSNDDQNSYKIRIVEADPDGVADDGDEINIAPVETSYQLNGTGCSTFWFFVPVKPELRLSNFDMDGEQSVDYTDPDGLAITGTVSGQTVWNNGGGVPFPPPGGDPFPNPNSGWWSAVICIGDGNQYVFYPEGAYFIDYQPHFPDLTVNKDDGVSQSYEDEDLTYTIIVDNNGAGPALDVTLTDTLPSGTSYINATGSVSYQYSDPYEIITWDTGLLVPGESDTVYLTVHVAEGANGPIDNWVHVSHSDLFFNQYSGINDNDQDVVIATGSIGDYIWDDANGDGIQDPTESGRTNIIVYLVDAGGDTTHRDTTNAAGYYLFQKVVAGSYTVYVDETTLPSGAILTTGNQPLPYTLAEGENYTGADFGYRVDMIAVELAAFSAQPTPDAVTLVWRTRSESDNLGFKILRRKIKSSHYITLNREIIPGAGSSEQTHEYSYEDVNVESGATYNYLLQDVDFFGHVTSHGPIEVTVPAAPQEYELEQNFPNPFNPDTNIKFSLKESGHVLLTVYNIRGQIVRTLVSAEMGAGSHSVVWKGRDDNGEMVPSGTYLYTLRVNDFEKTRKMSFMK